MSLAAPLLLLALAAPPQERASAPAGAASAVPPEKVEVVQVVSGDTLRVRRAGGAVEELHLLSVDAEEPTSGRASDGSKPTTAFGEQTLHWLRDLLRRRSEEGGAPRVLMSFPEGERRDVYGRLLGHAALLDGTDLSLLLVEEGKSPYYNKYGNSLAFHERFLAAQRAAREAKRGIWAGVSDAASGGAEERRPYPELIAWWQARAEAVDAFRRARAERPEEVFEGEDPAALARAARAEAPVELFVEPVRLLSLEGERPRLVLRSRDRASPLELVFDAELRKALGPLELGERIGTFRQNYLWLVGRVVPHGSGWHLVEVDVERCRLAGPEPELPGLAPR